MALGPAGLSKLLVSKANKISLDNKHFPRFKVSDHDKRTSLLHPGITNSGKKLKISYISF